jgi:hypothetical protein
VPLVDGLFFIRIGSFGAELCLLRIDDVKALGRRRCRVCAVVDKEVSIVVAVATIVLFGFVEPT